MATRLVGVDTADPHLPNVVVHATQGVTADDFAPGNIAVGLLTQAEADARYVGLDGDTMAGGLILAHDPTVDLEAATKRYVDDNAAGAGVAAGGTTGQVLNKTSATDYATGWTTLTKTSVGLDNVDNTSDAAKPVSTAQATALLNKADKVTSINTTAPLAGGGTLAATRTLTVDAATETAVGVVELATTAEASTGTDTTRAVTAAGLKTTLDARLRQTINAQTGTTYTLVLADESKLVTMTNAASSTLTVPPNSAVAFAVGARIDVARLGAGSLTLVQGSGVTITATPSLVLRAQGSVVSLIKLTTDGWLATGDLT